MSHPLLDRIRSPEPEERAAACRDTVEDPSAILLIDALGEALGDPVPAVARAASAALARLAQQTDEVAAIVRRALRSDDPSLRWHAALTSARIAPPTPRLLPAIVEAFASPDRDVRWMAARLLVETGRVNPEVLPLALGLATGGESVEIRSMAMHCIRELGPERPETSCALIAGSRDPDRSVRRAALTAIAALTDPPRAVFDRLFEVIADSDDSACRKIAARSVIALARDHFDVLPEPSIAQLRQLAKSHADPEIRSAADRALERARASAGIAE